MLFSVFIYGQDSITEKYYQERGYSIPPRTTHIEQPAPSNTSYLNLIPRNSKTESIGGNKQYQTENKRKLIKDSIRAEAMKLSFADKQKIKDSSVKEVLNGIKDERLNLTENENTNSSTNYSFEEKNDENKILYAIIVILVLLSAFLMYKFKISSQKNKLND
ncbi:hypothetical protein FLTE109939_07070 [Flavobacterium terrigena]|uniref:Uncharacterized protein n=2 Tax=Flavobacterium terrigena TaxID=402734 RepID=A0A1H6XCC4_9FLAO|nr:hypothetical protein SAMN05660918_2808 [Flavobacterium terrigena]